MKKKSTNKPFRSICLMLYFIKIFPKSLDDCMQTYYFFFFTILTNKMTNLLLGKNKHSESLCSEFTETLCFIFKFCQACCCDEKIGLVRLELMPPLHQKLIWSCCCYTGQQTKATNLRSKSRRHISFYVTEKIVRLSVTDMCLFSVQWVAVLLTILYQLFSQ